jgi:hypothetical protein
MLIQRWQPALNYPFVLKLQFTSLGIKKVNAPKKSEREATGRRLWAKVARRNTDQATLSIPQSTTCTPQKVAWQFLYDVASYTERSYKAARILRSNCVTHDQVYALFRLAANMDEPYRTRVKSIISSAMSFRNMTVPTYNKPLALPYLCHRQFFIQPEEVDLPNQD